VEDEGGRPDRQRPLPPQQGDPGLHRENAGAAHVPWTILVRDGAGGETLRLHQSPGPEPAPEQGLFKVSGCPWSPS
jgi:hypothetical protein